MRIGLGNQSETSDRIATALQMNRNTLKNNRDAFDRYTGSHRQGWNAPLRRQLESVLREIRNIDEATLRRRVLEMIRHP